MGRLGLIAALLLVFAASAPPRAYAVVDMKNANYAESWLDYVSEKTGINIRRTYNSRTLYDGMFGFGWCSDFESKAVQVSQSTISLTQCGAGQEVDFTLVEGESLNGVDEAMRLIDRFGAAKDKRDQLRSQLISDTDLRQEWLSQYGAVSAQLLPGRYVAQGDVLVVTAGGAELEWVNHDRETYDLSGNLTGKQNASGAAYAIERQGDQWILHASSGHITLTRAKLGKIRITSIEEDGVPRSTYKYDDQGDLIEVKNAWKNTYRYRYTKLHNIVEIDYPDGTTKKLTYNENKDWVTAFQDRKFKETVCVEAYDYRVWPENFGKAVVDDEDSSLDRLPGVEGPIAPSGRFGSASLKSCNGEDKNLAYFLFRLDLRSDGSSYLNSVLTRTSGDRMDVRYNPDLGRPSYLLKNGLLTAFAYDSDTVLSRTPYYVAEGRNQSGCDSYEPTRAWFKGEGLPRAAAVRIEYDGQLAGSGGCRLGAISFEIDGETTRLTPVWKADREELSGLSDGDKVYAVETGPTRLSWRPACLAAAQHPHMTAPELVAAARRGGACSKTELAVATAGLLPVEEAIPQIDSTTKSAPVAAPLPPTPKDLEDMAAQRVRELASPGR